MRGEPAGAPSAEQGQGCDRCGTTQRRHWHHILCTSGTFMVRAGLGGGRRAHLLALPLLGQRMLPLCCLFRRRHRAIGIALLLLRAPEYRPGGLQRRGGDALGEWVVGASTSSEERCDAGGERGHGCAPQLGILEPIRHLARARRPRRPAAYMRRSASPPSLINLPINIVAPQSHFLQLGSFPRC